MRVLGVKLRAVFRQSPGLTWSIFFKQKLCTYSTQRMLHRMLSIMMHFWRNISEVLLCDTKYCSKKAKTIKLQNCIPKFSFLPHWKARCVILQITGVQVQDTWTLLEIICLHNSVQNTNNFLCIVLYTEQINTQDKILPLPGKSNGVEFGNQDKHSPGTRRKACTGACVSVQVVMICLHSQL